MAQQDPSDFLVDENQVLHSKTSKTSGPVHHIVPRKKIVPPSQISTPTVNPQVPDVVTSDGESHTVPKVVKSKKPKQVVVPLDIDESENEVHEPQPLSEKRQRDPTGSADALPNPKKPSTHSNLKNVKHPLDVDIVPQLKESTPPSFVVRQTVEYGESDIRNASCVNKLFNRSLSALQNAPIARTFTPEVETLSSSIRLKVSGIKFETQLMMENIDGERTWKTVGYGSVKHGTEFGAYAMASPKVTNRDYFIAKNYQDHPSTMQDGVPTLELRLPSDLFQFPQTTGLAVPPQLSAYTKKKTT